jgi:hypothetical protein
MVFTMKEMKENYLKCLLDMEKLCDDFKYEVKRAFLEVWEVVKVTQPMKGIFALPQDTKNPIRSSRG